MQPALIDTDILSYFLKGDPVVTRNVANCLEHHPFVTFSIITYYEICSGLVYKDARNLLQIFEKFAAKSDILQIDEGSCQRSSQLYAQLQKKGNTIDDMDLLIAGIAIEHDLTLITNNEKHFLSIPGLKTQNWKQP